VQDVALLLDDGWNEPDGQALHSSAKTMTSWNVPAMQDLQ
jgi:hypothetical protein